MKLLCQGLQAGQASAAIHRLDATRHKRNHGRLSTVLAFGQRAFAHLALFIVASFIAALFATLGRIEQTHQPEPVLFTRIPKKHLTTNGTHKPFILKLRHWISSSMRMMMRLLTNKNTF
jgi:hypothetical protein